MRFLCLHGMGTNSRIFASQTAAIRHSLDPSHAYDWLDGAIPTDMAPGMEDLVSPGDEFLQYGVANSGESLTQALLDLEEYIEEEGPFDGLMAFSQGAGFGATYLIRQSQQGVAPAFRFAVFFCGAAAQDPCAPFTDGGRKLDGVIKIPTAHIWGQNDKLWHFGPALSQSCLGSVKEEYIHDGGHEIPGPRDPIRLARAVQAVQRTISRAQYAQE